MAQLFFHCRAEENGRMTSHAQKVVVVAYRRGSFTRDSNCKALSGEIFVFWIGGHLSLEGGRLQEVVAHGGSTVMIS